MGGGSGGIGGSAGAGASCQGDPDCDGVKATDNCPQIANPDQSNQDRDGLGDACDATPGGPDLSTQLGECGPGKGTRAVVLHSVTPSSVCPGDTVTLDYDAGGDFSCGANLSVRLYAKADENGMALGSPKDKDLDGPYVATIPANTAAGTAYIEMQGQSFASIRLPIVIGGAGLALTIAAPSVALVEQGTVDVTVTGTADATLVVRRDGLIVANPKGPSASVSVSITTPGSHSVSVSAVAPDGCTVTRSRSIKAYTCNPVLKAGTVLSVPSPGTNLSSPLLVCADTSFSGNPSSEVYVEPGGTTRLSGIGTAWIMPGGAIDASSSGIWTVLYTGPTAPSGSPNFDFLQCPSMTFNTAALTSKCP